MNTWTVAGAQMDIRLGDPSQNLNVMRQRLQTAADAGARLVAFPECALTGYGYADRAQATAVAETLPGRASDAVASDCAKLGIHAIVGMLEKTPDGKLFNAAALIGPAGLIAGYRKVHLPYIGVDRLVEPGDRPFAVHDLGGLRVGMGICFDGSFPETARALALLGADLIVLPTNWALQARKNAELVCRVRAMENHVYFLSVNRIGEEGGFTFIGCSSLCDCTGDFIARADHDRDAVFVGQVDPEVARQKKQIHCAGEYEIDRINWRRPEFYGPLTANKNT